MSNPNDIWNSILSVNSEVPKEEVKPVEQPVVVPIAQTNPSVGINFNSLIAVPATTEVIEVNEDDVEGYEDEDVSIPETNLLGSFNLDGPIAPAVQPAPFTFDLGLGTNPPTQEVKRGRGRPPKAATAQDVMHLLPNTLNTEEDKSKSYIGIANVLPQAQQNTTEITTTIPKKSFRELAESLQGIVNVCKELGKE